MKVWKVDTKQVTVRQVVNVDGVTDSDGENMYSNTHFIDEAAAWDALKRDVHARVSQAGDAARRLAAQMRKVEAEAAEATVAFRVFGENDQARQREGDRG